MRCTCVDARTVRCLDVSGRAVTSSKRAWRTVIAVALAALLAACGSAPTAPAPPQEPPTAVNQGSAREILGTVVAQTAAARGVSSDPIRSSPTPAVLPSPTPTTVRLPTPRPSPSPSPTGPTRVPTRAPTEEPVLETRTIISIGNLQREPSLDSTVVGVVCVNDIVDVLEVQQTPAGAWYRVEVTKLAPDCAASRVRRGTRGWISDVIVLPLGLPTLTGTPQP